MERSDLRDSDLTGAVLTGTDLASADLRGAVGVFRGSKSLEQALVQPSTRLDSRPPAGKATTTEDSAPTTGILPTSALREYTSLGEDFRFLEEVLLPAHRDAVAQADETIRNLRRWNYVLWAASVFMFGILVLDVTVFLNTLAATIFFTSLGILAVTFTAIGTTITRRKDTAGVRQRAERLKGEYFRFLGRVGPYLEPETRRDALRKAVAAIMAERYSDESRE